MKKAIITVVLFIFQQIIIYSQVSESFEGTFPPTGWSVSHNGGTSDWVQSSSNARSGAKCANSTNPAAAASKFLSLNLSVESSATTIEYYISVSSISNGTGAVLKMYAGSTSDNLTLLRTIDLENLAESNTYYGFTDYIDGTSNQSGNSVDIRNDADAYIEWVHYKVAGTAASCRLDDVSISNASPLPVELTSFTSKIIGNTVNLKWNTATEVENYGFDIQRSVVGGQRSSDWEKIGFVHGHGNSNSPKEYSFVDNISSPNRKYFYRLKQIDNDGNYDFSGIVEADFGLPNKFELKQNYPNPFNPSTEIGFALAKEGKVTLNVYNVLGVKVATLLNNEYREAGYHTLQFTTQSYQLPSGIYYYKLESSGNVQVRKMILQK